MTAGPAGQIALRGCHDCGQYTRTQYSRCEDCRRKRLRPDRKRRHAISRAVFPRTLREAVLQELRNGGQLGQVCQTLQITTVQLHGFARINAWFRAELDDALMKGRDPGLQHGSECAYRIHRCRCPECRAGRAARR